MILNHKLAKAEAMSCQIQSQIVIPCQLPVDGYDWNVLFGNLLDNAIEAMEQIKDRFWGFGYNMTGEFWVYR